MTTLPGQGGQGGQAYRRLLQGVRVKVEDLKKILRQLKDEGLISWKHQQVKWLG